MKKDRRASYYVYMMAIWAFAVKRLMDLAVVLGVDENDSMVYFALPWVFLVRMMGYVCDKNEERREHPEIFQEKGYFLRYWKCHQRDLVFLMIGMVLFLWIHYFG